MHSVAVAVRRRVRLVPSNEVVIVEVFEHQVKRAECNSTPRAANGWSGRETVPGSNPVF
jgi:hypothetical protein